jgi:hypothetical protein
MYKNQLFDNVSTIQGYLFDREDAHLANREMAILDRHILSGGSKDGFRHMGQICTRLVGPSRQRGTFDRLNSSLAAEMGCIQTARHKLDHEKARIKQALILVLRDTHSFQDMRDALPNCLRDLVPVLKRLERTREEAYTLLDNPRAFSQYMSLREKIEFYVAARLLY